jgi:hypothetical protein
VHRSTRIDQIEVSQRGGHTGAGNQTYDQGMVEAGKPASRTNRRLRLAADRESPISVNATAHGQMRRAQGYSAPMLVEESRLFQVATFGTLHLYQSELDHSQVLLDVAVIADEVDAQLMETVRSLMGAKLPEPAAA